MDSKQLIWYEQIHVKISYKYKIYPNDDFDPKSIQLSNIENYIDYCYGMSTEALLQLQPSASESDQYIMRFIEMLKDRVIRHLPELSDVEIMLGIFDSNNMLHRLIVFTYNQISKILKKTPIKNIFKSIFTVIKYKNKVVFIGNISF